MNGCLPLVDAASLVSQGDGDGPCLAQVEVLAVVVVVRRDPAHPHGRRLLSGKHSHRVVVLGGDEAHGGAAAFSDACIFEASELPW